jgi:DNA-binding beta-propeller fold protein YncE
LLALLLVLATTAVAWAATPAFAFTWGTRGSGNGQFEGPSGVAVDPAGSVYVADGGSNQRIQKFSSTGTFITAWGTQGSGNGQFHGVQSVAVDGAGNVYVTDTGNARVQKFTGNGAFLTKWGTAGSGDGQFNIPFDVAVDGAGNVYVTDQVNDRVQKFSGTGAFLTKWGTNGNGDGEFAIPGGIAVDGAGNVYVADAGNNRVQKFSSSGAFLTKWGTVGSGDGQFRGPIDVAVDGAGTVYVVDALNHRVQRFTNTGTFIDKWGTVGSGPGQFADVFAVALNAAGSLVYVAELANWRIQAFTTVPDTTPPEAYLQFDPATKDLAVFGRGGEGTGVPPGLIAPEPPGTGPERTYRIVDGAGNSLVLVVRVQTAGGVLTGAEVVSLQYNNGPVQAAPRNRQRVNATYAGSRLTKLVHEVDVGRAEQFRLVAARYSALLNATTVADSEANPRLRTFHGLRLLRLATDQGQLRVEY